MAPTKKKAANDTGAAPKKRSKKNGDSPELLRDRDIERVKVKKEVPMSANPDEAQRMSREHAKVTLELKAIEDEIAEFMSKKRKRRRELKKEDIRLATAIDNNVVMKTIECVEERIYATMTIRWVDEKGNVLDTKAMPPEMLQKTMFEAPPAGDGVEAEEEEDDEE